MHTASIREKKKVSAKSLSTVLKKCPPVISLHHPGSYAEALWKESKAEGKGKLRVIILLIFLSQHQVKSWLPKTKVFITVVLGEN